MLFLYRVVLAKDLGELQGIVRATTPRRLPVVLTRGEVSAVLARLDGVAWLVVTLLYGAGLRLQEALDLRVKDIDIERGQLTVRQGKGRKDRTTMLPGGVRGRLDAHLTHVRRQYDRDIENGLGAVPLPDALSRKYPNAGRSWSWQFVFPATRVCRDPRWGGSCRFHLHESAVQRAVAHAVRAAGLAKRSSCHTFRHSFATHLLEDGYAANDATLSTPVGVLGFRRTWPYRVRVRCRRVPLAENSAVGVGLLRTDPKTVTPAATR